MGIDKKTSIGYSVIIDKVDALLKAAEEINKSNVGEKENKKKPQLWFTNDLGEVGTEEYYFEDEDCSLHYTGVANTPNGNVYIWVDLPLSDIILIDVLAHSIKRLNKLKTALETLK